MAEVRIRRERLAALGALHQRARDYRKRADDGRLMLKAVFRAQAGNRGPKPVDDRQAARGRQQVGQPCESALARGTEALADIGFAERPPAGAAP